MIFASKLQFEKLQRGSLKKIKALTERESVPPRYPLGAITNLTMKPHVRREANFSGFFILAKESDQPFTP